MIIKSKIQQYSAKKEVQEKVLHRNSFEAK